MAKEMTLCMIYDLEEILLGMKKRGFGQGRWNGFGGKVRDNETKEAACIRELGEEAGIEVSDLLYRGKVLFEFNETKKQLLVHIFSASKYVGDPKESEEMLPKKFKIKDIPYDEMWDSDKYFWPLILEGKNIDGYLLFDGNDKVMDYEFTTLNQ